MSKLSLHLYPLSELLVNRSIVIGGPARSGTRILGSLFQTLKKTEYSFEPPLLYSLIPMIEVLPKHQWKHLFESYLVEEFLLNAVAGRYLNFNEHDYSCVRKSQSEREIAEKMSKTLSRIESLCAAKERTIVAKIPDLTVWLEQMVDYYPKLNVIIMLRKPESIIGSFNRKGWFSDETLSGPNNYPPYKIVDKYYLSYLVADEDADAFIGMNNIERSAYYYVRAYAGIPNSDGVVIIDYDDFVQRPREIFYTLADHFDLRPGDKTEDVLDMVKEPVKDRSFSWDGVDMDLKKKVYKVADDLKRRAIKI